MDQMTDFTTSPSDSTDVPMASSEPVGPGIGVYIIWAGGGALLIALFTLIICILRTHRKTRNESAARRGGSHSRTHGGVNPSFTPYDEIWTWIPVVRDTQDNCQTRVNPSARTNNPDREQGLLSTLTLPTYREAVSSTSNSRATAGANNRSQTNDSTLPLRNGYPSQTQNVARNQNAQGNRGANSGSNPATSSENVYDTIASTTEARPSISQAPPSYVTSVSVTNTSGASISCATAHAHSTTHAHNNQISRDNSSNGVRASVNNTQHTNSRSVGHSKSQRLHANQSSNMGRIETETRHRQDLMPESVQRTHARSALPSDPSSFVLYPRYHRQEARQQPEFRHSPGSMFSYTGTPDRQIRSGIPPYQSTRDAPPPYHSHAHVLTQASSTRHISTCSSTRPREYDIHRSGRQMNFSPEYTYF